MSISTQPLAFASFSLSQEVWSLTQIEEGRLTPQS